MKFAPKAVPETSPNIAPLLDVVLLLLIFFMVTSSFAAHQLPLDLPDAESPAVQEEDALVISIDARGGYSLNDEPLAEIELAPRIQALAAEDRSLEIRADATTPHGDVVRILDLANQFNLTKIGIRVDPAP